MRFLLLGLALATLLSCGGHPYVVHHRVRPTCDAACDYYLACKSSNSNKIRTACVSECQEFFTDHDTLREFQRLRCPDAVAFIEGSSGRPPGSAAR